MIYSPMPPANKIIVFGQDNGKFKPQTHEPESFLTGHLSRGVKIVFASWELFQKSEPLKTLLNTEYAFPSHLWEKMYHLSNGYADSAVHTSSNGVVHTSCFHFLIKHLIPSHNVIAKYDWYEMTFFIHSNPDGTGAALLFCFDAPEQFRSHLIHAMNTTRSDPPKEPLAFLQSTVVKSIELLYDTSVWNARQYIRDIEQARTTTDDGESNFRQLHDLARHVIHICEVLEVAVDTVQELINGPVLAAPGATCTCPGVNSRTKTACPHSEMRFSLRMLRNFGHRAASLKSRLLNEINLGFNVVVQRDSKSTMEISLAARSDSASMKTISVVTLAFLPATFVSTVFSMSFFELSVDETGQQEWNMSDKFWIYWVIAVPLTIMTLVAWTYGQRAEFRRLYKSWKTGEPKAVA